MFRDYVLAQRLHRIVRCLRCRLVGQGYSRKKPRVCSAAAVEKKVGKGILYSCPYPEDTGRHDIQDMNHRYLKILIQDETPRKAEGVLTEIILSCRFPTTSVSVGRNYRPSDDEL